MSISGSYFYNQNIRKMVQAFGYIFSALTIRRIDSADNILKTIKVPLAYANKEKYIAHLQQADPSRSAISMQLPRMSFEYTAINPDPSRKLTTTGRNYTTDLDKALMKYGHHPVPFTFDFQLNIMTKFAEDTTQIIEQILPFFTPDFTLTVNENTDLGISRDIPITFVNMSQEDTYDGDFSERRAIISTLSFEMKGYIYGPTKTSKIIKDVTVGIIESDTLETLEEYNVFVTPLPAGINDDYGFTETFTNQSYTTLIDATGGFVVDESGNNIIS